MAWTTPRTWTDGELVTAAIMNLHLRDNLDYLKALGAATTLRGAKGYLSASQTLPASTWTKIVLNAEEWDTDNEFNTANGRFTAGAAMKVLVLASAFVNSAGTSGMSAIYKNGAAYSAGGQTAASLSVGRSVAQHIAMEISLALNDYLELYAYQNTPGNQNVGGDVQYTFMVVLKLGD